LINLISWEVCCINVRSELGFERCTNPTKSFKFYTTEKFVILDLFGGDSTKAMFGITDKAKTKSAAHFKVIIPSTYLRIKFSASGPN